MKNLVIALGFLVATAAHAVADPDADALARARARKAAEQLATDARTSGDTTKFVACGQAYLDIHNKDPGGAGGDEVLYNAAVCFEEGKAIGAALQAIALLKKSFPSSRLAPRALARTANMYVGIASYDKAAAALEEYAAKYAGEKDAADALHDAIRYRAALGDTTRQIANTRMYARTYGAKKPKDAAAAMLALLPAYERTPADAIKLLQETLKLHGGRLDDDQRIFAHARLGELLWQSSCPVTAIDGLCVRVARPPRPAKAKAQCGPESPPKLAVVKRTAVRKDALAALQQAVALHKRGRATAYGSHAAAMAAITTTDDDLERMLEMSFPTKLDFNPDPKHRAARERSTKRFNEWMDGQTKAGRSLTDRYSAVISDFKGAQATIAAMARLGQLIEAFLRELETAEIPKDLVTGPFAKEGTDAYCGALKDVAEPLRARAVDVFGECLVKARELGIADTWWSVCRREGMLLAPDTFPGGGELHADPSLRLTPSMVEKNLGRAGAATANNRGEQQWRAGDRDAARKSWEDALKLDGKLFAAHYNLAAANLDQLRALPTTDRGRAALESDAQFHASSALAVDPGDPAPLVLLATIAIETSGTNRNKLGFARFLLEEALRRDDKHAPAYVARGVVFVRRGDWTLALHDFEKAATLAPSWEDGRLAAALAALHALRLDDAKGHLDAVKTPSYDREVARGMALRMLGKLDDARAAYEAAAKQDPARADAHYDLGILDQRFHAPSLTDPKARRAALERAAAAFRRAAAIDSSLDANARAAAIDKQLGAMP